MAHSRYSAGLHAVARLLEADGIRLRRILVDRKAQGERVQAIVERAATAGISIQRVPRRELDNIARGTPHQGVIAELKGAVALDEGQLRSLVEDKLTADETLLLLILDGVQDPHNLGACLRCADGAGADAVVVPRRHAAGITPSVRKVASGAAESVPVARVERLTKVQDWLRDYGVALIGTCDKARKAWFECDMDRSMALVLGGEERGISEAVRERCEELVSIPMRGDVESLNVSVAAGICLYERLRQRAETTGAGN